METDYPRLSRLRFTIEKRNQLESSLDSAVIELIRGAGTSPSYGILVTRHDHRTFTVEFCKKLRPGFVMEQDLRIQGPSTSDFV